MKIVDILNAPLLNYTVSLANFNRTVYYEVPLLNCLDKSNLLRTKHGLHSYSRGGGGGGSGTSPIPHTY